MNKLSKIDKELLQQVADLHKVPEGSYNIRLNGQSASSNSNDDIQIIKKTDKSGIDIIIKSDIKNKSVHIPAIVTKEGFKDLAYNDFYVGDNAEVTIVAGCGIHASGKEVTSHQGIHTFHIGQNAKVKYIEKHLGLGTSGDKIINPATKIIVGKNSKVEMETIQLGGVSYSDRKTSAILKAGAQLDITEKILTTGTNIAKTDFVVKMLGDNCSCNVVSRSVAKDKSQQTFKSKLVGKAACFGRVECDAILIGEAKVKSIPEVDAQSVDASLNHEATVGKIAGDQLLKLMSLGLSKQEAEEVIIKGYLR